MVTVAARAVAGIRRWPGDALRHSWVTYRFALTGDAVRTAAEAGHDQAILHRHYRPLATKSEAEKWFGIASPVTPARRWMPGSKVLRSLAGVDAQKPRIDSPISAMPAIRRRGPARASSKGRCRTARFPCR